MKNLLIIIMVFVVGCAGFKPKYLPTVATEDLTLDVNVFSEKPRPTTLYTFQCPVISADGVFYPTEEHDKLVRTLKKCAEFKAYSDILISKYHISIKDHNTTIKDYNKMVKVYYDEKSKKKTWMFISIGSIGIITSLILFLAITK